MDPVRQIRYLIPPIFLLLSLTLGAWTDLDHDNALRTLWQQVRGTLGTDTAAAAIVTFLLSAAVVLAAGVVIAGVSHLVLVGLAALFGLVHWFLNRRRDAKKRLYIRWEVCQTGSYFERICAILAPTLDIQNLGASSRRYCALITFDHGYLWEHAKGVHEWSVRRWNWFNVNSNSAVALGLSLLVGPTLLAIEWTPEWCRAAGALMVVFILNAGVAWDQVQRLHDFQSYRVESHAPKTKRRGISTELL